MSSNLHSLHSPLILANSPTSSCLKFLLKEGTHMKESPAHFIQSATTSSPLITILSSVGKSHQKTPSPHHLSCQNSTLVPYPITNLTSWVQQFLMCFCLHLLHLCTRVSLHPMDVRSSYCHRRNSQWPFAAKQLWVSLNCNCLSMHLTLLLPRHGYPVTTTSIDSCKRMLMWLLQLSRYHQLECCFFIIDYPDLHVCFDYQVEQPLCLYAWVSCRINLIRRLKMWIGTSNFKPYEGFLPRLEGEAQNVCSKVDFLEDKLKVQTIWETALTHKSICGKINGIEV